MSKSIDEIVSEALALPPQARAFMAEKLIESLDAAGGDGLSEAWREEVRKRCREIDEESVKLRDADDAFARAYSALG
jgi:putative addiction module component (TIGR02574 family)